MMARLSDDDQEMLQSWNDIREKYAVEDEPIVADAPPQEEGAPQEEETPGERARDDQGRYTKQARGDKDGQGEQTQARQRLPSRAPAPGQSGADQGAGRPAQRDGVGGAEGGRGDPGNGGTAPDLTRAPSSWKPGARSGFEQLPEAVRAEIHRRETDFLKGQQQLQPDAQLGSSIRRTIEPYRMLIEAEGGTPERAVADLLRTAAIFRTGSLQQKYQAVANICQQFGLDPSVLTGGALPPEQQREHQAQQFRDPRVDQLLAQQHQADQQRQSREQAQTAGAIETFMAELDEGGNPRRPYLNDVIPDMAAMLPALLQANPTLTHAQALEEAYTRATWAHPEVRALLQREAASASEAQRRAANQTRVAGARRAASVNVPRRAALPAAGKPGTIEDTIAATARELGLISS
jgi:hypothetical protein